MADSGQDTQSSTRRGMFLFDLFLVTVLSLLALVPLFVPSINGSVFHVAVGLLFVFFAPGYAFISALFPSTNPVEDPDVHAVLRTTRRLEQTNGVERVVLALGMSLAIVPFVGLFLNFTSVPIAPWSMLQTTAALTMALAVIAAYRRLQLPVDERFAVDPFELLSVGRDLVTAPDNSTETALNVLFAVGIVLAMSGLVYAVASPGQGERYTEFYLLSEDPETNELVAENYPTEFTVGEAKPIHVGVQNKEHETASYTVVVELHRFQERGNQSVLVQTTELDRFQTSLAHNETYLQEHEIRPTIAGDTLRLTFLLYQGDPAANPTVDNAYRHVHLWIESSA